MVMFRIVPLATSHRQPKQRLGRQEGQVVPTCSPLPTQGVTPKSESFTGAAPHVTLSITPSVTHCTRLRRGAGQLSAKIWSVEEVGRGLSLESTVCDIGPRRRQPLCRNMAMIGIER